MPLINVPITRLDLGDEEIAAVARVLKSGWIMQGPEVAAFEAEIAAYLGAAHAVAVSNGTVAIELALRALDVGPGDEVVTVSASFIATANAVRNVGATPVFVDVRASDYNMDPARVAAAIGPKTRAVLVVHQLGFPADLAAIRAAAGAIPIVEDAACALGSELLVDGEWQKLGRPHGVLATFSFHPRKLLTTAEGGLVTTSDTALAARVRRLRQHGAEGNAFVEAASNHRLTDLQAAIGRVQLRRYAAALAERRRLAARWSAALVEHPTLAPPDQPDQTRPNWQSYPCRVDFGQPARVMAFLAEHGIATRPGLTCAHREPAYAQNPESFRAAGPLDVSERLAETTIMLPIFQGMTADEERAVIAALASLRELR
jgi:dTDP-4-amino-4,6-dideoxygalactose transaminase